MVLGLAHRRLRKKPPLPPIQTMIVSSTVPLEVCNEYCDFARLQEKRLLCAIHTVSVRYVPVASDRLIK